MTRTVDTEEEMEVEMPNFKNRSSQSGASLVESLIASALLLIIAVAVFPMFHRSVASNISGGASSEAANHSRSQLEHLFSLPIDSQVFDLQNRLPEHTIETDSDGEKMSLGSLYFDARSKTRSQSPQDQTHRIGTGAWVSQPADANGLVLWQRRSEIRQYSYNDISDCSVSTDDDTVCVSTGHPHLFDTPLPADTLASEVNFKVEDVTVLSLRPGIPPFRARLARTY